MRASVCVCVVQKGTFDDGGMNEMKKDQISGSCHTLERKIESFYLRFGTGADSFFFSWSLRDF